jgi:hypothetical protein
MGIRGFFPVVKPLECESNHSFPPITVVMNWWSYTSTIPHVFMTRCLMKHMDNFFFPFMFRQLSLLPFEIIILTHFVNSD